MTKKITETLQSMGVDEHEDRFGRKTFRPSSKIAHMAPVIIREYYNEEVNSETCESTFTRMYECEPVPGQKSPRHFIAAIYDANFSPKHDVRMKPGKINGDRSKYKAKKKGYKKRLKP